MTDEYHREIVDLLIAAGQDGMSVSRIAKWLYNKHTGFFVGALSYPRLRNSVQSYLWRQSQQRCSPFRRAHWGHYAMKADFAVQLDFVLEMFWEEESVTPAPASPHAVQLELF